MVSAVHLDEIAGKDAVLMSETKVVGVAAPRQEEGNRFCYGCSCLLPRDMFPRGKARCRPCLAAIQRRCKANWTEEQRQRVRERGMARHGKEPYQAQLRVAVRRYIARNPHKRRAHRALWAAIRRGDVQRRPCEVCGAVKVDAHHDDYDKPLEVRWLCRIHHRNQHQSA